MSSLRHFLFITSILISIAACSQKSTSKLVAYYEIISGDQQLETFLPLIKDKRVAIVANHASLIGNVHLVDTLLKQSIEIVKIFSPEHGFRGTADAGEVISDKIDAATGISILSLYGKYKKPPQDELQNVDILIFDLQDVGVRFFTYISTLTYIMEACAEENIPVIVLDRPNPNGFYIDGPVLEAGYESFVGIHKVPIVYGMTLGEYALMVNGEGWLKDQVLCDLTIIPLKNYKHSYIVKLPVKPSPNLPNWKSVYLYPSLCLFEGTIVSVGRGTDVPFQVYGHPDYLLGSFIFIPESKPGASNPKYKDVRCFGQNLSGYAENYQKMPAQLNLRWLIESYKLLSPKYEFFTSYFAKLAGSDKLRQQIEAGKTEEEIRKSWQADLDAFKEIRRKYLLYD
jgi:uncharacterized protein YbbC (DUF1343 family)